MIINTILFILGREENLSPLQMCLRAVIVFFSTLLLIRFAGVRVFGKRSSLDTIIIIVMGSVLARGIVGASSLIATFAASAVMIILHRLFAWLSIKNKRIESLLKGKRTILFEDGKIIKDNLQKADLSETELLESLHLETKHPDFENVEKAYMETNGRISFILKSK